MNQFRALLTLLRPHQWLKNGFVFLPVFFSKHLFEYQYIYASLLAFIAYSFAAGAIYCFNDIWDVEMDRLHPKKSKRPIASGALPIWSGYLLMAICLILSVAVCLFFVGEETRFSLLTIIAIYVVMNIAYCVKLKQIALIDVFIISVGFVLRLLAGSFVTTIDLSHWIVLMTFLLALFLALAKRRDDVVIYMETGVKGRRNIMRYNLEFLNQAIAITASIMVVCYCMYSVSDDVVERVDNPYLYTTSLFVLLGVLRYLQLTIVDVRSGSPTKVLMHDRFLQLCVLAWVLAYIVILYC